MKKIGDLMSKNVVQVTSVTLLPEVAQKMRQENIGAIPVEEGGRLVGIVTDRDIAIRAVADRKIDVPVREVMTPEPKTCSSNATVREAVDLMGRENVRRLAVMDNGRIVGIVTLEDLVEAGEDQLVMAAMRKFHERTRHG